MADLEKKVSIEVSEEIAYVMQRMLVDEINNQHKWAKEDKRNGRPQNEIDGRFELCEKLKEVQDQLYDKGFPKFHYYN